MGAETMVKVNVASAAPGADGEVVLKLSTVDGPEVEFALDDVASALLAFTLGFAIKGDVKTRIDSKEPIIYKSQAEA